MGTGCCQTIVADWKGPSLQAGRSHRHTLERSGQHFSGQTLCWKQGTLVLLEPHGCGARL